MLKTMEKYKAAEYPELESVTGFSQQMISNHLKLYQGYVNNTNTLSERLAALLQAGEEKTPEYAEMKRRFGWEYDGMRLHELYFENFGPGGSPGPESRIYKAIQEEFGGFEDWRKDFAATASTRGIGWTILYQERGSGRLFNAWINEHDGGHLVEARPLLVLDAFEHAYMTDFQVDRPKYIEAFLDAVNWEKVSERCLE